ncbi:cytochrome c biogenesis protein ResB [Tuberibacillus sp. Marseille-P3662]|uniref:cytochrome c biogenesis protein ResB n=1 Tax=Tuberibacillus sp. Marseille-P3662 TaxID=1965358 RepID=UPI000A1CC7B1|nr:cytochrome c biogenesis protein ResB [Tuberibacillus sp. Marseille-P3662]
MSQTIHCECGHRNPEGTILCEACGKPLDDSQTKQLLTMRYEGSARRSQTYKKTIIDKVWNTFSSVKVGITLILLILVAIAIGTILPQLQYTPATENTALQYYQEQYGSVGKVYVKLGFHELYKSWWFATLLGLLGTSLIIASIDRFVPLRRALKNQSVTRHERFIKRQRVISQTMVDSDEQREAISNKVKAALKNKRYKITEHNGDLLAEKGRFSRWGPYVNHIGLILILISGMLLLFPGVYVNQSMWVREGEQVAVPATDHQYYIRNHKFIVENYDKNNETYQEAIQKNGGVVKNYQTNVSLYKQEGNYVLGSEPELSKVKDDDIKVNHPLEFGNYKVYQQSYQFPLYKMSFKMVNPDSGKAHGQFTVNLDEPESVYQLKDGYKVKVIKYFPDFYWNQNDEPATRSPVPNNPAFIFKLFAPDKPKGEVNFIGIKKNYDVFGDNKYSIQFVNADTKPMSGLVVHKNLALPLAFVGAIIFLMGVAQGMYWNHRRIWLQHKNGQVWLAALTNKNWMSIKKDINDVTSEADLNPPVDRLDDQESTEEERGSGT